MVDNSCIVKTSGGDTCGLGGTHTDIGAAMYWVVCISRAYTASQASRRIVLWFMGTAEESRVLRQFWTQVRYMGCRVGAEESEGAVERTLGRGTLSGHSGVILIVNRIRECSGVID